MLRPVNLLVEGLLVVGQRHLVAVCVPVHQAVHSDGDFRKDEGTQGYLRLDCSRSAYAEYVETAFLRLRFPGDEVYVCEGVQFIHHYVYVVAAYARGEHRDPLSVVAAGHAHEFPGTVAEFLVAEVLGNHIDPARVAHEYDIVSKFFRAEVKMENGSVRIDYKF